jgi:hypothetical protein
MKHRRLFIVVLLTLVFTACSAAEEPAPTEIAATNTEEPSTSYPVETETDAPTDEAYPVETETQETETGYPVETETQAPDLRGTAELVINSLADKDMEMVANFVHPERGVRFSPYAFVRDEHQVFLPQELPDLLVSEVVYTWGNYDGTGEPIALEFEEYYEEFVYSADFADSEQIAVNERLGQGNAINNIGEFYPGSSFVEYHFSGFDEEYEGMDWESLRLVFVQKDGAWWLVGIVHDEWTI